MDRAIDLNEGAIINIGLRDTDSFLKLSRRSDRIFSTEIGALRASHQLRMTALRKVRNGSTGDASEVLAIGPQRSASERTCRRSAMGG